MSGLVVPRPFTRRYRAMPGRALLAACVFWFGLVQPAAAQDTKLTIGGTGAALGTMRLLGTAFEKANPGVTVNVLPSLGSTGGTRAVISGAVDIGPSMRPLSEAERGQGGRAVEYARAPVVSPSSNSIRFREP